jgi:hypothetical protein
LRDLPAHVGEPAVQEALQRYLTHAGGAVERLEELSAQVPMPGTAGS